MITIDASVWTALFEPKDTFHTESVAFLRECERRRVEMFAPSLAIVETACAMARRQQDGAKGLAVARSLRAIPVLRWVDMDMTLIDEALACGTRGLLRGADAVYAAAAISTGTTLVTWDNELIERAGGVTPTDWCARKSH
ncbi:MAG: type II toxin-antitoxin system VapC family toxin [Chthoniobacterales bacterium]